MSFFRSLYVFCELISIFLYCHNYIELHSQATLAYLYLLLFHKLQSVVELEATDCDYWIR